MRFAIRYIFVFVGFVSFAQFSVSGVVKDSENNPLAGALITLSDQQTFTDLNGGFSISGISHFNQVIQVSYIGFQTYTKEIQLHSDLTLEIILQKDVNIIEGVTIYGVAKTIENKQNFNEVYLQKNFSGSLIQSLENIAGVNAMSIGSGSSKPIIRGLGFNRVVVSINSSKHEGQQWGADHNLEVDAFSVESVELLKGASSMEYGSDAIGGVLNIRNNTIPDKNYFSAKAVLFGKSVNNALGTAFDFRERKDRFFYKIKGLYIDFGDYNIPTDTIVYLTRKIPIHNRKLKNTAGQEWNFFGQAGYVKDNYHSILTVSNNQTKSGFFPGSHGIPDLDRLQDDGNSRNIKYPYQQSNHFTIQNEHKWIFDHSELKTDFTFQNNRRKEKSEFHTHYSNQTPPEENSDLELDFNLNTFSGNTKYTRFFSEKHKADFGLQVQIQDNNIKGYSFLLPRYNKESYGIFALHSYRFSNKIRIEVGLRYDFSNIDIKKFYDELLYDYLIDKSYPESLAEHYALRSPELSKDFSNFNLKTGVLYTMNDRIDWVLNIGSSFRNPTVIELGANGVHHGSFRHEKGNENLNPEKGYVIDFQMDYKKDEFRLNFNPYLYYFTNYIFLRPTGEFSVLPHSGQIYQFSQTKAILTGFELENRFSFSRFSVETALEYLYNKQIQEDNSKNFPLPFSPPFNTFVKVNYSLFEQSRIFKKSTAFVHGKYFSEQTRIAQNEETTASSLVFGTGFSSEINLGKFRFETNLSVQNIFDTKYYNHISFYRALEVPEQGRNIQLMIQIPI